MYDEGFRRIVNIETSSVVIGQMASRNAGRAGMEWHVMDATNMTFERGGFDLVVDRSVLDTFACMGNSSAALAA